MEYCSVYQVKVVREGRPSKMDSIVTPETVFAFFQNRIGNLMQEAVVVLFLDAKNKPIGWRQVSLGPINTALIHPREIFSPAIQMCAAAIILVHNHPSGNLAASPEDKDVTRRMRAAGELLGIELLDHIILSDDGYFSFRDSGEGFWA